MLTRRGALAAGTAALALTACGEEEPIPRADGLGAQDIGVLSFALQLELFERDLYEAVVRGGPFRGEERRLIARFGEQEAEHAEVLTGVLRRVNAPLPEGPAADLERLASGSRERVLRDLADIEDLGANAYAGAAPDLLDRDALALALSIHSVEARHAAVLARRIGRDITPAGPFAAPASPPDARQQLAEILGRAR